MEHPKLLLAQAQELKEELVATRRHLHQHPELSDMEFETALFIERKLDESRTGGSEIPVSWASYAA